MFACLDMTILLLKTIVDNGLYCPSKITFKMLRDTKEKLEKEVDFVNNLKSDKPKFFFLDKSILDNSYEQKLSQKFLWLKPTKNGFLIDHSYQSPIHDCVPYIAPTYRKEIDDFVKRRYGNLVDNYFLSGPSVYHQQSEENVF